MIEWHNDLRIRGNLRHHAQGARLHVSGTDMDVWKEKGCMGMDVKGSMGINVKGSMYMCERADLDR